MFLPIRIFSLINEFKIPISETTYKKYGIVLNELKTNFRYKCGESYYISNMKIISIIEEYLNFKKEYIIYNSTRCDVIKYDCTFYRFTSIIGIMYPIRNINFEVLLSLYKSFKNPLK